MTKFSLAFFSLILLLAPGSFAHAQSDEENAGADVSTAPIQQEEPIEQTELPPVDSSRGAVGDAETQTSNENGLESGAQPGQGRAPQTAQQAKGGSGFTALAPIPGLTDNKTTSVVNSDTLATFFNNLYKYLIGLAAALAVIMIVWGGIEYATQDVPFVKSKGKERITEALFGLVLILSPYLVFSIINPSILNLSLNLPPLDTRSGSGTAQSVPVPVKLPTCSGAQKTNCVPRADVVFNEGTYVVPPPGAYCFKYDVTTKEGNKRAGGERADATLEPYFCAKNFGIVNDTVQACRSALVGACPTFGTTVSGDGLSIEGPCPTVASACKKY